jgi:hypothetical protein
MGSLIAKLGLYLGCDPARAIADTVNSGLRSGPGLNGTIEELSAGFLNIPEVGRVGNLLASFGACKGQTRLAPLSLTGFSFVDPLAIFVYFSHDHRGNHRAISLGNDCWYSRGLGHFTAPRLLLQPVDLLAVLERNFPC